MRARPALAVFVPALFLVAEGLAGCCTDHRPRADCARLDIALTEAESPQRAQDMIMASMSSAFSPAELPRSYSVYYATNGPSRWFFIRAANAPRGLDMFNLYCYEQQGPGPWLLRGFIPVNAYYYTNSSDRDLTINLEGGYVNVVFRGAVIFTGAANESTK
jgi:hypothetical protein